MSRTRLKIDVSFNEEEQRRDPIEVEIPGLGVFEMPGVMNALATVRVARWAEQGKTELNAQEAVALLGDLVPDDVLRRMHARGFDILEPTNAPIVEQLVMQLVGEYQERALAAGSSLGKARPEHRTPALFSGTRPSSEPTSYESTASPFRLT